MSSGPSVIVNKSGFLSSLAKGVFGTLAVAIVCASALGFYGMRMFDRHVGQLLSGAGALVPEVIEALAAWQKALPPALADALNDRRAPEYATSLAVAARICPNSGRGGGQVAVVEVANQGAEAVTLHALRLVVEDGQGVPLEERIVYAATPLAVEDEWRGPLWPGQTRRIAWRLSGSTAGVSVTAETTDLRVWCGPAATGAADAGAPPAPPTIVGGPPPAADESPPAQ